MDTPTFGEMQTVLTQGFLCSWKNCQTATRGLEIVVLDAGEIAIPGPSALFRNDLPRQPF